MKARLATVALAVMLLFGTTSCAGDDSSDSKTLTYWASNQATSLAQDRKELAPVLKQFKKKTGITVDVQVIGWPDLYSKILAATTSGQGPDVLNIGNTWAPSLQATGAFVPFGAKEFKAIGGKERFVDTAMQTGGAAGKAPTSVPYLGLAYGLYYNKQMFADAGLQPPTTWQELVADAEQLTNPSKGVYGMAMEGGSYTESVHFAFIFGMQHGAPPFDANGKPDFTSQGMVDGVRQYVDLMGAHQVVNPSSAQYKNGPEAPGDFAQGKTAMLMSQNNADNTLRADGMKTSEYGVVPIPTPSPLPPGGQDVSSHVAGINLSIFKGTENMDGALKFVRFMTSPAIQRTLDRPFTALPVNEGGTVNFTDSPEEARTFQSILSSQAAPLPRVPAEGSYETNVGNAVNELIAQAATGQPVSDADIRSALQEAQDKMATSG